MINGLDDYVTLEPISHRYFDKDGREYESVSRFIGRFKQPFDREMISRRTAKSRKVSQATILAEWDKKRDNAIDHGNRIHDALDKFDKTTIIDPENEDLRPTILAISVLFRDYYRNVSEAVLYDTESLIAGTTDKILQTTSHAKSVIDFDDYKTNLSKGIEFKSSYGNYMTGPVSHLQDCNYNHYALQLSTYAYLFQKKTGRKIGMLNILFIPPHDHLHFRRIPVPYMKLEVEAMFRHRGLTDDIVNEIVDEVAEKEEFDFNEEDF